MATSDQTVVAEVAAALGSELSLLQQDDGIFIVVEMASSRRWRVPYSAAQLAQCARDRARSAIAAGAGAADGSEAVSPGAALLAIHISEAVASAEPHSFSLHIEHGGVRAL